MDLDECRLARSGHPEAHRVEGALDAARDDVLLLAVLGAAQQLLAQVVVHAGVGAAARGARQRHALGALAVTPDQQLGARADEGQIGCADAPAVAGREELAQRAEHRTRVVGRGAVRPNLAGENDLFELSSADALHRALDGVLIV